MATEHGKGKVLVAAPIPKVMLDDLDKAAQENDRSRSAEIRVALRKHLYGLPVSHLPRQGVSEARARG